MCSLDNGRYEEENLESFGRYEEEKKGLVPVFGFWSQSTTAQSTFSSCPGVLGR